MKKIIDKYKITNGYNPPKHNGIDFAMTINTAIYSNSVFPFILTGKGSDKSAGNYAIYKTAGKWYILEHLNKPIKSKIGTVKKKGATLGFTGNTGNSTGPHLHVQTQTIDPLKDWVSVGEKSKYIKKPNTNKLGVK
jgi:murein DD-endopeptidase MepM/ murein hydrolase activator NlpD